MTLPLPMQGSAFTLQNADVFIPEIWMNDIIRFRDSKMLMANSVKKIPFIGKKGDTLRIPRISRLGVFSKLPETPVNLQSYTETEFTMTVDQDKEASFMIEDIVGMQAAYNLRSEYTREAGYALARDLDNSILALRAALYSLGQKIDAGGSGNSSITAAEILAAKEALDAADVPAEGRTLWISPQQESTILTIDRFIAADYIQGSSPTQTGRIAGSIFGATVMVTTQIGANTLTGFTNGTNGLPSPTPGVAGSMYYPTQDAAATGLLTAGNNKYSALYTHSDWAILGMQMMPRVTSSFENLYQADVVVSRQIYGVKLYRPESAVVITSTE